MPSPSAPSVTHYALTPPRWPQGLSLKLAVIADLHACNPWMGVARIDRLVAEANAQQPDAVLLLGDYVVGHKLARYSQPVTAKEWAGALAGLRAPLGVHAVLGNHDWWDDRDAQRRRCGPTRAGSALQNAGITLHENTCLRVAKDGGAVWLAGLGDQWAFPPTRGTDFDSYTGVDDLAGTLAQVTDDAPIVLMAHEPDIFPERARARSADGLRAHAWRSGALLRLRAPRPLEVRQPLRLRPHRRRRSQPHRLRRSRLLGATRPLRRAA